MAFCSPHVKKRIRISLAGFMSVWLSGVVFLFCCEQTKAKTGDAESCPLARMSANHCPMSKGHKTDATVIEKAGEDCVECCAFLPVVFDKSRKVEQPQKQLAATSGVSAAAFTRPVLANFSVKPAAFRTRVPARNKIFITHCVFRI